MRYSALERLQSKGVNWWPLPHLCAYAWQEAAQVRIHYTEEQSPLQADLEQFVYLYNPQWYWIPAVTKSSGTTLQQSPRRTLSLVKSPCDPPHSIHVHAAELRWSSHDQGVNCVIVLMKAISMTVASERVFLGQNRIWLSSICIVSFLRRKVEVKELPGAPEMCWKAESEVSELWRNLVVPPCLAGDII